MKKLPYLLAVVLFIACSPKPQMINYGSDQCNFCRMTIVDERHAAEIVTTKGKVFKFDSAECMIHYIEQQNEQNFALYLVNDYLTPGELIDATSSIFLISSNVPSPMGANITAFADAKAAESTQKEQSGDLYDWDGIKAYLKK